MKKQLGIYKIIAGCFLVLILTFSINATSIAEPVVSMQSGTFKTAVERKALQAFRVDKTKGFRSKVEATKMGERLFNYSPRERTVSRTTTGTPSLMSVQPHIKIKLETDGDRLYDIKKADPSSYFFINKSTGDISFHRGMNAYINNKPTKGLPRGEKEAIDSAKRILGDLKLMPEKLEEMVVRHVGGMKMAEQTERGETREVDKLITVHFGRKIDGIDVGGPGSKIVVSIGTEGELVALTRRWIEVKKEAKKADQFYPKKSILKNVRFKLVKDAAEAKSINSSVPELGYYDDGQGNIEPAYFVTADLEYGSRGEGMEKISSLSIVPALKDARADFIQLEQPKTRPRAIDRPIRMGRESMERDNSDE